MAESLRVNDQQISFFPRAAEHDIVPGPGGHVVVFKSRSKTDRVISFLETSNGGPFRLMQMGDRICKLMGLLQFGQGFSDVSNVFSKAWAATVLPHLPFALRDAKNALQSLGTPVKDSEAIRRRNIKVVQDVSTAAAACGYTLALFSCIKSVANVLPPVMKVAEYLTLAGDLCDLQQNTAELSKAHALRKQVSVLKTAPELQQHFVDVERVCVLKTMKSVCAVSGFILGTGLAVTGLASAPAWMIAATTLSLVGTALAFGTGVYEEGMRYERTKFFSDKHVQRLPMPAVA